MSLEKPAIHRTLNIDFDTTAFVMIDRDRDKCWIEIKQIREDSINPTDSIKIDCENVEEAIQKLNCFKRGEL